MYRYGTHRGFIQAIMDDPARLDTLLQDAVRGGILRPDMARDWRTGNRTKTEVVKALLDRLGTCTGHQGHGDLDRLIEIRAHAARVHRELLSLRLWRHVFSEIPILSDLPLSVKPLSAQGFCNYTFHVRGRSSSYVIRYHDPLGKAFLQRHDPMEAVRLYCAAESLFKVCLGDNRVVTTLFPKDPAETEPPAPNYEDRASVVQLVRDRILVQPDYSRDHFVLADYARQHRPLGVRQLVDLYAPLLARLHGCSRALGNGWHDAPQHHPLRRAFLTYRHQLRFPTSQSFQEWLQGPNWMSRRVLHSLRKLSENTRVWAPLLRLLRRTPDELIERCSLLWTQSADGMRSIGALAHLDYNPGNIFVNRKTRTDTKVFDFDYIAILDPAYDIGLALNSLLRLVAREEAEPPTGLMHAVVERFFAVYSRHYGQHAYQPCAHRLLRTCETRELEALCRRSRAFAGLALAVTLDDDRHRLSGTPLQPPAVVSESSQKALLPVCAQLIDQLPDGNDSGAPETNDSSQLLDARHDFSSTILFCKKHAYS